MRVILLTLLCLFIASCGAGGAVKTEAELAAYVAGVVPTNASTETAQLALSNQGFTCWLPRESSQLVCQRKLPGIVCNQLQFVYLPASSPAVGTVPTKLGSVCL